MKRQVLLLRLKKRLNHGSLFQVVETKEAATAVGTGTKWVDVDPK